MGSNASQQRFAVVHSTIPADTAPRANTQIRDAESGHVYQVVKTYGDGGKLDAACSWSATIVTVLVMCLVAVIVLLSTDNIVSRSIDDAVRRRQHWRTEQRASGSWSDGDNSKPPGDGLNSNGDVPSSIQEV